MSEKARRRLSLSRAAMQREQTALYTTSVNYAYVGPAEKMRRQAERDRIRAEGEAKRLAALAINALRIVGNDTTCDFCDQPLRGVARGFVPHSAYYDELTGESTIWCASCGPWHGIAGSFVPLHEAIPYRIQLDPI